MLDWGVADWAGGCAWILGRIDLGLLQAGMEAGFKWLGESF